MDEIRIGLIGTRRGAFVAGACDILGRMRLAAIYDLDGAGARAMAADTAGCRAFGPGEWEAFLAAGLDAVVIASPIPCHVEQSVACLARGLHVLCEVTAAGSVTEARQLARAAAAGRASYMLAENCCFLDAAAVMRGLARDGVLGELYYAEGGYLHDCRYLWRNPDGSLSWRGRGGLGVYCTHPLGPILDILDDRVTTVACRATPAATMDPEAEGLNNHLLLMTTAGGRSVFVRVDHMGPQPYRCKILVQGTRGVCAFTLGVDDMPRLCLDGSERWESTKAYLPRYLADRQGLPEAARMLGHGSMEYWMMQAWRDALLEDRPPPIDVHRGLDYTLPGLLADASARRGGRALPVPDSRAWVREI